MNTLIDGKKTAQDIQKMLKEEIESRNLELKLAAVLVGDDPEFKKFVEQKVRAAERVGIVATIYKFPGDIDTTELKRNILEILDWCDGMLVELPLPSQIDSQEILDLIPVEKDVDVLSNKAQELFYKNKSKINPPAVEALKIVLEDNEVDIKGKKAAVFGQGILVGKPIAHWLEQQGAEVSRIRSKTENPDKISLEADIVVAGVGKPDLINGDMVKEGAIVIDFGYGKKEGKMCGDVELKTVKSKASLITPVPGGIGPVLVEVVLKNLVSLQEK